MAVLALAIVVICIQIVSYSDESQLGYAGLLLAKLPSEITLVMVILLVSIPEGLPITVGISMAFSVLKMYKENILVKKLDAPEKLGSIEEIVCGKTGTLT